MVSRTATSAPPGSIAPGGWPPWCSGRSCRSRLPLLDGALLEPLESEFGWSRSTTSGAVTANLVIYGLTAPFAAALMERFGIRRVVAASLLLVAVGSGLTTLMTQAWQLWLLWGLAVGIGTGAMALVLGAIVANRWFAEAHRGLVTASSRRQARPDSSSSSPGSRRSRWGRAGGMPRWW